MNENNKRDGKTREKAIIIKDLEDVYSSKAFFTLLDRHPDFFRKCNNYYTEVIEGNPDNLIVLYRFCKDDTTIEENWVDYSILYRDKEAWAFCTK